MADLFLYLHPDGLGSVEYDGELVVSNEWDGTESRVLIGPAGLRGLARRLAALANALDGMGPIETPIQEEGR